MGMAFAAMTVFLRTEMHQDSIIDGGMFMGAQYFMIYLMLFNGFSEMAMVIAKLSVFYKQRALLFYPPWAYALPSWFLRIPIAVIEVSVFALPIYYVIGFDPNIGRFFRQYIVLLLLKIAASALIRFLGAAGRTAIFANTFGALVLITMLILGGYLISRGKIYIFKYIYGTESDMVRQILVSLFGTQRMSRNGGSGFTGSLLQCMDKMH